MITSGANTYTGATNIDAGTLRLDASSSLPSGTAVTIASGSTLDLNSYSNSIGSLSGAGTLDLGGGTLTIGSGGASSTFAGSFVGGDTGTFAKAGTGTLTFGAGMTLSAGSLVLSGGTLDLGGYSSSFGSLSVTADSILDFGAGSGSTLSVLNSLTINSGVTLTVRNWTDAVDYFVSLIDPGATTLGRIVFTGFSSTDTKWHSYDNQITPVPEPSTYGIALLSICSLVVGWRRRRVLGSRTD
ncbi:MAG: hypothetical protein A3G75_07205 [Verrucomicrobia bacterium RIFCSPLOWO2_12_FULL_64_8]|nr:MAG: hypothetical protein A3G75_07205 [Verrucomicrobia bacterium RIFCSPLOWO2_12_FULL_64_8]